MSYSTADLRAASDAGIIAPLQLDALLAFLGKRASSTPTTTAGASAGLKFDAVHLLWYAGALIVMSAMGLFTTLAFSQMGGKALAIIALVYAAIFGFAGHHLWTARNLRTPGGLMIAIAVSMAPLAVFGVQESFGLWGEFGNPKQVKDFYVWIKGSFIFMEIAAIVAGVVALRFYRFPFIVLIPAIALWFMSMDIVPWITGSAMTAEGASSFETARRVSMVFGLGMIAAAVIVNTRQRSGDFAFWLYLFGVATFWGAVSASSESTNLAKAVYCAMNVGFLGLAVFLGRRVFALFGTIGIAFYLGDLADKVFADSLMFPFALSLIGVGIIAAGLWYNRHQAAVGAWVDARMPDVLRRLRPADAIAG